ncbi:hypothetical protein [Geminocystis sp.]|uniref:hypothetical protein n=1 Tax=Geminocystis sp. TaxID=2664100 RepID=UPI003593E526
MENKESSLSLDLDRDGNTLLIIFGGIQSGLGIPPFEFKRITDSLPVKLIFIRDLSQAWYHLELPSIGNGINDIILTIESIKQQTNYSKVVCIGNSMGGYAALLIGSLIQADQVLSFVPQTFISKWLRIINFDNRWKEQINKLHKNSSISKQMFDLKVFLKNPQYKKAIIFSDRNNRLDALHASRLKSLPRTTIEWRDGGHSLIKQLRDNGELQKILIDSCR